MCCSELLRWVVVCCTEELWVQLFKLLNIVNCSVLRLVAACCSVLQCIVVCCDEESRECGSWCVYAGVDNAEVITTHLNIQQHTATYCSTQVMTTHRSLQRTATHCNALQRTATHCNALQHISGDNTLQHNNTLQHAATRCNMLQHTTTRRWFQRKGECNVAGLRDGARQDAAQSRDSFKEPCVHSKEPCVHSKEPCVHSKEPCVHSKEPRVHSKEPCSLGRICDAHIYAHMHIHAHTHTRTGDLNVARLHYVSRLDGVQSRAFQYNLKRALYKRSLLRGLYVYIYTLKSALHTLTESLNTLTGALNTFKSTLHTFTGALSWALHFECFWIYIYTGLLWECLYSMYTLKMHTRKGALCTLKRPLCTHKHTYTPRTVNSDVAWLCDGARQNGAEPRGSQE